MNCEAWNEQRAGFYYNGIWYTNVTGLNQSRVEKGFLHFSLNDEMEGFLKDKDEVSLDQDIIRQFLYNLLRHVWDWQDIRDALPDCLSSLVPETQRLSRTRPVGWTLDLLAIDKVRDSARRQFEKLLPKIEFYMATRLIY
jgi:hypothetical protein